MLFFKKIILSFLTCLFILGCGSSVNEIGKPTVDRSLEPKTVKEATIIKYPKTKTEDIVETIHGVKVSDPYRWLEDDQNEEVKTWQTDQTKLTRDYLDNIKGREEVRQKIASVYRVNSSSAPIHKGKFYFQTKRNANEDQPVLYVSKGFPSTQRELINPNTLGDGDNTVALDWWFPSWDGTLLAYGLSHSGSERSTLYIVNTITGKKLVDEIPHTRSARVAWLADKSGIFYSRRPNPESGDKYFNKIYFHKMGTNWKEDKLIYGADSTDDSIHEPFISPNSKHLIVAVYKGAGGGIVNLHYRPAKNKKAKFKAITNGKKSAFWVEVLNNKMLVLTNYKAPKYRVIQIDYKKLDEKHWKEILKEGDDPVDQILILKDSMVVKTMHHAAINLTLHKQNGEKIKSIELPTLGRAYHLSAGFEDEEFFFEFTSFVYAGDIYKYKLADQKSTLISRIEVPFNPDKYVVEQVFYKSKDGTQVPMFVAKLKDLNTSQPNPTMITAYGGFNIALTPYFLGKFLPYLDAGGIFAMPNLRGGSEYGEQWHKNGMLDKKQNTFDDFIAAAQYLIDQKITTSQMLGIRGGSNGGLLVGAAMVQQPDLYSAVVCAVPLLDMIRYHMFLIAKLWIPEYGSSDNADQFKYLHAYSPYHNVKKGAKYPATLILTAESDSRVAPLHARKFAAMVQANNGSDAPIYLHVEKKAGHGQGKPISMRIEDSTDVILFLMDKTGLIH